MTSSAAAAIDPLGDRAALAEQWRALEAQTEAPPYLAWDWTAAWLDVFAPADPAVVRIGSPPIAIGLIERRGRRWAFAGAPVSPTRGLLVADGHEQAAWSALADALRERSDWTSLSLAGMPEAARALPGAALETLPSYVVDLPDDFEAYLSERPSTQRKGLRQKLRRIEKARAEISIVAPPGHPEALREFLRLHGLRAAAKGERHPQMDDTLGAMLARLDETTTPALRFLVLEVDGATVGVSVRLDRGEAGGAWFYNGGFDPAHHRLGPGVALELASIRDAIGRGHRRFDLGAGYWRYKTDLGGREVLLLDGHAYRPSLRGRGARTAARARRRVRESDALRKLVRRARHAQAPGVPAPAD